MKNYLVAVLIFLVLNVFGQEVKIGEKVPAFKIELVEADQQAFEYDKSLDKVILIDFWATWCAPCIAGMQHLQDLQLQFKDRLQVLTVSEEKHERISRFKGKKKFDFLYARDQGDLRTLFPYKVIPHSILIAPNGNLVAITSPDQITNQVITQVLEGKPVHLQLKKDPLDFDPNNEYFQFDENAKQVFQLQPYMEGVPTFSKSYIKGPFKNRRLTIFNLTIAGLYRKAYEISDFRLIYEFDESQIAWSEKSNRYCLNVITEKPDQLYPYLQKQLYENTEVVAKKSKAELEVLVISKVEGGIKAKLSEDSGMMEARGDGFKKNRATINEFCNYLEHHGIVGMAVIDETADDYLYDINFSFDPENPQSFKNAMTDLGLTYKKDKRKTDVLILSLKEKL